MSKRKIHIERLQIRLPRNAAGTARQMAAGLGDEILRGVAEAVKNRHGEVTISEISAGKVRMERGTGARGMNKQIAAAVTAELAKRFE